MLSRMAILGDTSTSTVVEFLRILSELALRASYIELYSKNNRLIQVSFGREDTNEYQDINRFYPYPFVEAKSDKDISILP